MDPRLVPINGLIALVRGDGGWPTPLGDAGLSLHLLEAPVQTTRGLVVADALLGRRVPPHAVLVEAKSGANVEVEQGRKYKSADARGLQRQGSAPPGVTATSSVGVLYLALEEHRARISRGLQDLELEAALLSLAPGSARLTEGASIGVSDFEVQTPMRPPGIFPIDHQSPPQEVLRVVAPVLVAAMAREGDVIDLRAICREAVRAWDVMTKGVQVELRKVVTKAVRELQAGAFHGNIDVETGRDHEPRIRIIKTPRDFRPQGRTQGYQRLARRVSEATGGRPPGRVHPGQEILFDELADIGGLEES